MYAIVWSETRHVGVVAARMEGKWLAMTVLTVLPQFIATKPGEEAQTGPAEYLAASAIMSRGQYSFEAQCSLPCLTTRKAASALQANQSMQDQSSPNIMAPNHLWGDWPKLLYQSPCAFSKSEEDVQIVGRIFGQI